MDTKSDEQFLVIKANIESNKKEADKNHNETNEKLTLLADNLQVLTELMIDKTKNLKSSPSQKDTSTPPEPTNLVPTNKRALPLEVEHSTKIRGMWTLKHDIRSPKFYELLIKTELKGDTSLDEELIESWYSDLMF